MQSTGPHAMRGKRGHSRLQARLRAHRLYGGNGIRLSQTQFIGLRSSICVQAVPPLGPLVVVQCLSHQFTHRAVFLPGECLGARQHLRREGPHTDIVLQHFARLDMVGVGAPLCIIMVHNGVMKVSSRTVRQSVSLPASVATQVRSMAKTRRLSANRMLVELIEDGMEAQRKKQQEFFDLAERFRNATNPEEAKRLGDELGRMVFGG